MNRIKFLITSIIVIIASILVIFWLFRDVHPLGGLNLQSTNLIIQQKSLEIIDELSLTRPEILPYVELRPDNSLISYLQKNFGIGASNDMIRRGIPGYYWDVGFKENGVVVVGAGRTQSDNKDLYNLKFDVSGRLIGLKVIREDSSAAEKISRDEAEKIASVFLTRFASGSNLWPDTVSKIQDKGTHSLSFSVGGSGNVQYKNEKKTDLDNKIDYNFVYSGKDTLTDLDLQASVTVSGDVVSGYTTEYILPAKEDTSDLTSLYEVLTKIFFYVVVFIIILVVGYRRVRAFEIGFRTSIIMGILTALCFATEIYLTIGENMGWELLIPLIIGPLFYASGVVVIWAVGETITRENWNEKFISTDLITKGYILHSKVGYSLLYGISAGAALTALFLLLTGAAESVIPMSFKDGQENTIPYFKSSVPGLLMLNHFLYSSIFIVSVFFLFVMTALRRRLNTTVLLIVSAVLWGLVNTRSIDPLYAAIIIEVLLGFLLVWIFYKTDLLTILVAVASGSLILNSAVLFWQDQPVYAGSSYFIIIFFVLIVLLAVIALFTKDLITDFQNITPAFVKNITERQRLQRELEIARDVQMSFLPRNNPDFKGLDVASRCFPANEVGGDYYDFVYLADNKSGIIVGDVSGKGTQAAFYMTLTKGFLKAVSSTSDSPSEVLSRMNELFFENVERGTFISMIYGVFDTDQKKFRLARAGHNPVIVKSSGKGSAEMLNPTGLALGLEKGIIFRKTIKEIEIPCNSGEVYVFYTDGFTEAMNRSREEYGEERLLRIVEKFAAYSADEILNAVFDDVKVFIGKALQHDDMTMVVVKIR